MRWVFDNLNVCCLYGGTEFGFKNASVVCLEQLILAVEPLVDFTACKFLAKGRLPGNMGFLVDSCVALGPDFEE
jgi:hypothetical protein